MTERTGETGEGAPTSPSFAEPEQERAFAAERNVNVVRLAMVIFLVLVYGFLMDKAGTMPVLAYGTQALALIYAAAVLVFEPYRGYPVIATGAVTSAIDGTLIVLWLVATGGWASPFYPLWYVSIAGVAYRFGPRETAIAATGYGAAYALLTFATASPPLSSLVIRIGFIGLVGGLGSLVSTDVLEQITARRETEDLARQLEEEIRERRRFERDLEDHARRLEESTEELERRNAELEQFAHAVSHDLRTPLTVVAGNLELVQDRAGDELDEDDRQRLEAAGEAADRIDAMLESLLEYVRVETRGQPPADVDLDAVVDDVLTDLRSKIEATDAEVRVGELPRVHADRTQIYQVLLNLVGNALKFHGDAPPRVEVEGERSGDEVMVRVRDEGPGIDSKDRERIFHIFERGSNAGDVEGSGFGLALSRRIVQRHGGKIGVESTPGEGSTFWFTLPAEGEQAPLAGGAPEEEG